MNKHILLYLKGYGFKLHMKSEGNLFTFRITLTSISNHSDSCSELVDMSRDQDRVFKKTVFELIGKLRKLTNQ